MSAIWGMISKNNNPTDSIAHKMQESMKNFKIDQYFHILRDSAYFACGMQYFTEASHADTLPLYDKKNGIYFTADCVLTNRSELIQLLSEAYAPETLSACGDGVLSYKAYLRFGENFVSYLRGSFSFAIYNTEKDEVLLYADHFARRYLAYYAENGTVFFSTAYQPLLAVLDKEQRKINEHWIAAAYTDCTADTVKLHGDTVYENIYHVEPGQYVKIHLTTWKKAAVSYWNPLINYKKVTGKTDEEYRSLFLSTFQKAVNDLLCTEGEVGIMLSGGLDSSSVAAFSAIALAKENRKLYSYTAVPAKDYTVKNTYTSIENEESFILAQQQMYPNIYPQFISSDQINCFTNIALHTSCYQEPIKPIINMVNTHGMLEQAAKDGCRLMLTGQNGNATISYGNVRTLIYQKLKKLHLREAYREFSAFCKRHRVSRKYFIKIYIKTWYELRFKPFHFGEDCLLSNELLQKYKLLSLERTLLKKRGSGCMDTEQQRDGFCFMPLVYQHMGFYDTYGSLRYGILSVDPTLTKEMIELCLSLPIDCFVKNGKERRAVRDYMKGYVPDMILDNYAGRGVQAADYAYRVNRDWATIRNDVFRILTNSELLNYLDEKKLQAFLDTLKQKEAELDKSTVAIAVVTAALSFFLEQNE